MADRKQNIDTETHAHFTAYKIEEPPQAFDASSSLECFPPTQGRQKALD